MALNLLKSYNAKLDRALEHADLLKRELEEMSARNSYFLVREAKEGGLEHLFRIHFLRPPNNLRWSLIFGDAVHNLRSALDHLVVGLATTIEEDFPPRGFTQLAFPIAKSEEEFAKKKRRIRSLPQEVQNAIEDLQPYKDREEGNTLALRLLEYFDIHDKHRILQVAVTMLSEGALQVENLQPGENTIQATTRVPLEEGSVVLRIRGPRPTPYVEIAKGTVELELVVRGPAQEEEGAGLYSVLGSLETMRAEVEYVARVLLRFFHPSAPSGNITRVRFRTGVAWVDRASGWS